MSLTAERVSPGVFPLAPGMCEVYTQWWVGRIFLFLSNHHFFYEFSCVKSIIPELVYLLQQPEFRHSVTQCSQINRKLSVFMAEAFENVWRDSMSAVYFSMVKLTVVIAVKILRTVILIYSRQYVT